MCGSGRHGLAQEKWRTKNGGQGGIRTHETLARLPVFKTSVVVVNYLFLL
jgi:hypothetical protein